MFHLTLRIDAIYSYNANIRSARALIPTDTRVQGFLTLKIFNPFGDLGASIQLQQPQNQPKHY